MSGPAQRWRSILLWIALGLLSSVATLVAVLPAAWIAPYVSELTGGRLALRDIEGSVWSGSGQLFLGAPGDPESLRALPGRIAWRADLGDVLSGRLHYQIREPEILSAPIDLGFARERVRVGPGHAAFDLALLTALGAPFNTLSFAGRAEGDWGPWSIDDARKSGHADLRLVDIASPLTAVRPLGTYEISLDGRGDQLALVLRTAHGPLLLDADGTISERGIGLRGKARAEPGAGDRLADLLGVLGRKEDDAVAFSFGVLN